MRTKLVLFLLCMFALSFNAKAQIVIEETFDNDLIIIGNISSGAALNALGAMSGSTSNLEEHKLYCRLWKDKVTYGILIDTRNRVDDDFEFALGTNIEEAKQSIQTILNFMENSDKGKSIKVSDEDGRKIQINLQNRKGVTMKVIDDSEGEDRVIVDNVFLTVKNFERALKLLDEKADKVVKDAIEKNKSKDEKKKRK